MSFENGMRNVHPGEILLLDYLNPMDISVNQLAKQVGVSQTHMNRIINGHNSITPYMALRLEKAGIGEAEYWVGLQAYYDVKRARVTFKDNLDQIQPFKGK